MIYKLKNHQVINYLVAAIWFINGLFCKVLNLVPRHAQIVSKITESDYSDLITILIGVFEIIMAIWILSNIKPKLNAIFQILIVGSMNILEFMLVPDLLLWGKFNSLFALIFVLVVYFNNFHITKNKLYAIIS